jgi:hypothetical protein
MPLGPARRHWGAACSSGLFALTASQVCSADALDLVWQAPDTCATGAQVQREFERSTHVIAGRSPPHLSARASVEARAGRWVLHLHTLRDGVEGDREIEADSCASLTHAAALVLALAFGEGAEPATPTPPAPLPPPPPPTPISPRPSPVLPAVTQRSLVHWSMTLDGRIAWGPLPGPAAGAATTVDARGSWWGASARVVSWPGANTEPLPGLSAHFTGVAAALSLCVLARPSRDWLFAGCAGFQAGALRGTESGPRARPEDVEAAPWYAALPALRTRVRLIGPLHAEASFELATSVTRPSFAVCETQAPSGKCTGPLDSVHTVYVVPELSPSGSLGLSLDI